MAANKVTLTSAAISSSIGKYIELLGSDASIECVQKYTVRIQQCLSANQEALVEYCDAAARLVGGESE